MRLSPWAQAHYDEIKNDPDFITAQLMIEISEQIAKRMKRARYFTA